MPRLDWSNRRKLPARQAVTGAAPAAAGVTVANSDTDITYMPCVGCSSVSSSREHYNTTAEALAEQANSAEQLTQSSVLVVTTSTFSRRHSCLTSAERFVQGPGCQGGTAVQNTIGQHTRDTQLKTNSCSSTTHIVGR